MSPRPSRSTPAGRSYLDLQKKARSEGRPTDELLQLAALEAFLDRLSTSASARFLVLKGGTLLAAYQVRRPTRDVDLSAQARDNTVESGTELVVEVLQQQRDDGWVFEGARGELIREADQYSGVRVSVDATLASARLGFHVDINFGDPIWPAPQVVKIPRLLGGVLALRGYPIEMVLAEKIVTAMQRGTASTRWRDFADIYLLSGQHAVAETPLRGALERVATFRRTELVQLESALHGYATLAQGRWAAWVRRQRLGDRLPARFEEVLGRVQAFADPVLVGPSQGRTWSSAGRIWCVSRRS